MEDIRRQLNALREALLTHRCARTASRLPWTTLVLTVLWISRVVLAVPDPAPAEPVLLVLFSTGLVGLAALLSRYAARTTSVAKIVGSDGD